MILKPVGISRLLLLQFKLFFFLKKKKICLLHIPNVYGAILNQCSALHDVAELQGLIIYHVLFTGIVHIFKVGGCYIKENRLGFYLLCRYSL